MEHPFFATAAASARAETLRWLSIAENLLSTRDLLGSKSFATRARDADSTLAAPGQILAVVDTLLAGERRIGNNQPDFYSILRLTPPQGGDPELVAGQYHRLAGILNPQSNRFPFAEQAFRLAFDAWSVLSNPSRKSLYDREIGFYHRQPDPVGVPVAAPQQRFIFAQPQQQQVHGGGSSGSIGRTNFAPAPQVYAQPRAGPVFGGPTLEPQNFMSFRSGSNIAFGSKSGSEPVSNQGQDNYSTYAGYNVAASASVPIHEQLNNNNYENNNEEKQPQENYSSSGERNSVHNVGENAEETVNKEKQSQVDYSTAGERNSVHNVGENAEETVNVEDEEDVDRIIEEDEKEEEEEVVVEERDDLPVNDHGTTFWTTCPYCYYMYEYPSVYVDCTMRCQNCKRAFQAVVIPSPPPVVDGQDAYFCCWGFIPMGLSMDIWEKNQGTASTGYARRKPCAPRVYVDEDADIFADISSSSESDDDWQDDRDRKRKNTAQNVRGRQASGASRPLKKVLANKGKNNEHAQDAVVSANATSVDVSKVEGSGPSGGKQSNKVAKNFDKLDLNVELSNETGDVSVNLKKRNEPGQKEDDNMEGIGFFDGLDELFNNLPILKAA